MIEQLQAFKRQFANDAFAQRKIDAALTTFVGLGQQQLPDQPLPHLGFSVTQLVKNPDLMPLDDLLANFRQQVITTYGVWHLPNNQWLDDLHQFIAGRQVLEIMAGNGVITHGLRARGDQVVATDNFAWAGQDNQLPTPWTAVLQCSASQALTTYPFDVLIMSWATDTTTSDLEILQLLRQQHFTGDFIVIGEANQATNSPGFWATAHITPPAALNRHHQSFDDIKDQVFLVK